MAWHDERIDLIRNPRLRTILQRTENLLNSLASDPELFPVLGALGIASAIFLATHDFLTLFFVFGTHITLWFPFLFLLGVQYGRVYWRHK